jgi:hypothetical protein
MKCIYLTASFLFAAFATQSAAADVITTQSIWAGPSCEFGCRFISHDNSAKTIYAGDVSKQYRICRANDSYGRGTARVVINGGSMSVQIPENDANGRGCIDVAGMLLTKEGSADLIAGPIPAHQ